ncbi:MAG: DUF1080 domain-containing protein [Cyclobacteriaceae bacterium]|nr:DUF1080 domain-containing protein [Cyclobacteriaceae bacterium]
MKLYFRFTFLLILLTAFSIQAQHKLEGRWNMLIEKDGQQLPSWLEVEHSGHKTLVGRFVYAFGSARPVAVVNVMNNKFNFSIPPQWEPGERNMDFEGELTGETLKGTMVYTDGKKYSWTGTRTPLLKRATEPVWGEPIQLFNGKDLTGWRAMGPNQWIVENGVLRSLKSGSNMVSEQTFMDFKLHVEFRYDKGSNSGVYLRGRYEVQIEDDKGKEPWKGYLGAVYGFLTPSEMAAKDAGEWQSYDITLTGRMITVVANGTTIICNQEIPGMTGGAIDNKESEPGPIMFQGDHGPIDFRNIVITPAK